MNNFAAFAQAIHAALAVQGVTGELVVIVGRQRFASWVGQPNDGDMQCVVTIKPLYHEHGADKPL